MKTLAYATLLVFISLVLNAQTVEEERIIDIDYEGDQWNSQAHALIEAGDYEKAKLLLRKAIDRNPEVLLYYENLAIACKNTSDQDGLLACYSLAKKNIPYEASVFYFSGDALQNTKRYKEALADYNRAIDLADPDTELLYLYYFNRGNTWLKLRDYKNARTDYDEALGLNPYHQASYANRAMTRYNLKDVDGACEDWQQAKELGYQSAEKYLSKYCR